MINYYAVLGLKRGAGEKEITKAYRLMALKYHPDKRRGQEATTTSDDEMFQKCKNAYQALMDPKIRAELDLQLVAEEERKRRLEEMDEQRKEMRKELLERERGSQKIVQGKKQETTKKPSFNQPAKPEYALLLKLRTGGPLPINSETLSAACAVPCEDIHVDLESLRALVQFGSASGAAEVIQKIPFDFVSGGDWYLGVPPADLFKDSKEQKRAKTTLSATATEAAPVYSKEKESSVLERLRAAAAAKKQQQQ